MAVPWKVISSNYPAIEQLLPHLKEDYHIHLEYDLLYLPYPYQVESGMANIIKKLINRKLSPHMTIQVNANNRQDLSNGISIITGRAGTGKTRLIKTIIQQLDQSKKTYIVASYTGKAVSRLREVIGSHFGSDELKMYNPSTLHRLLMLPTIKFDYLIIDEASMVTTPLLYELLTILPQLPNIILVGDCYQLQPTGYGNLFDQLIESGKIVTYELTENHRTNNVGIMKNVNQLIKVMTEVKETEIDIDLDIDPDLLELESSGPFQFQGTNDFILFEGNREIALQIINKLASVNISSQSTTIITPYNEDIKYFNRECQKIYTPAYREEKDRVIDYNGIKWQLDDRVMLVHNVYHIDVMNGEEGKIADVKADERKIYVLFNSGITCSFYVPEKLEKSDNLTTDLLIHAFAITIHKSQGSEWDNVILYIPKKTGFVSDDDLFEKMLTGEIKVSKFLNRRLIYTALTRARRRIWCVGDLLTLNIAATQPAPKRWDGLSQRL